MILKKYIHKLYFLLSFILKVHFLGLLMLSLVRLALLLANLQNVAGVAGSSLFEAFSLGLFIDNIVVSYVSSVAILLAAMSTLFFDISKKAFRYCGNIYFIVAYVFILGLGIADIPYFGYFYKHMDVSVLDWLSHDTEGYGMIFGESAYYKYYLLFIVAIVLFSFGTIWFSRKLTTYSREEESQPKYMIVKFIILGLALALICYMGVRRKYYLMQPITEWTTFLHSNSFVNELTMNPVYSYMVSTFVPQSKDKEVAHVISLEDSFALLKKDFIAQSFDSTVSPISRKIIYEGKELRANVVVVLMESMSSYYVEEASHLTPQLNALKNRSFYFKNFYSAATHTNQGIFATLYGIPALFDKTIMDNRVASGNRTLPLCEGLPFNLNMKGYSSAFFLSHEKSFNNTDMFLLRNGYNTRQIYSLENYPKSEIKNSWGVADDYLFKYATGIFNKELEPFFGTIMTITNHPAYIVPKEFKSISSDESEQAVYFSDYCVGQFLKNAAKEEWYKNTIFVFVGDHGKIAGKQQYEMPLSLNHVPLLIYSPLFENEARVIDDMGTQIDIFPTIMGLLNMSYENNSLGIDLFREKRPYAVFTTDDKLGCINDTYLYGYNTASKQEVMYDYRAGSTKDISSDHKEAFDSIRGYAAATVQVTNYLLKNELTKRKQ